MKRMLINATQQEELRIALVDGQRLYDLDIESAGHELKKSNIYKGRVVKIQANVDAAWVDYGCDQIGFLPFKEISREYFSKNWRGEGRASIEDVIEVGQELIVQVEKDERGGKKAALTTFISLAGSYLVLMPNNPRAGGISRRIEGEERTELKEALSVLDVPPEMGLIIRTAGMGKSAEALQWDLSFRIKHWEAIKKVADSRPAPFLIHQESSVIVRAFRDYLRPDIGEILIDSRKLFEEAKQHIESLGRPDFISKIKLYTGDTPLFSHYQIESQIESAYQREVRLPSGGSIVIDATEALTAIDINSARSTSGKNIEETAFHTNLEAADEIARQLRLRDLGGLIVIDFIDMTPARNQREVESRLREAVRSDRARIQVARISKFGLLEMSRQRLSPSLNESSHHICPRCSGTGRVRDNESLSLSVLRLIEEAALKDKTSEVQVIVPVPIASFLLNEKRTAVNRIEKDCPDVKITIVPSESMQTPHYHVHRVKKGEQESANSYQLSKDFEHVYPQPEEVAPVRKLTEQPALNSLAITADTPPPVSVDSSREVSVMSKLMNWVKGLFSEKSVEKAPVKSRNQRDNQRRTRSSSRNQNRRDRPRNERQTTAEGEDSGFESGDNLSRKPRNQDSRQAESRSSESSSESRRSNGRTQSTRNERNRRFNTTKDFIDAPAEDFERDDDSSVVAVRQRRERRPLNKPVRVKQGPTLALNDEDKNLTETDALISDVMATDHTSTTQESGYFDTDTNQIREHRRSRRTPRHLRHSAQRRRSRDVAENVYPEVSSMPLVGAFASPEVASGKVWIVHEKSQARLDVVADEIALIDSDLSNAPDYAKRHESRPNIEEQGQGLGAGIDSASQSNMNAVQLLTEASSVTMTESQALSDTDVINVKADSVVETVVETVADIVVDTTNSSAISQTNHVGQVEKIQTIRLQSKLANKPTCFASSPATKAPAPPYVPTEPKLSNWIRPQFDFEGKGAAGGHAASKRASAPMTKPNYDG